MNRFIEAATRLRRITWLTILGLVLVPLGIGGVLMWGTWNATDRLDGVKAAVVNNDEGTKINGQTVPLGRQLAAELVKVGSDGDTKKANPNNYDWVITDNADAADGLDSGKYAAVVTIPKNFSASATSYAGDAAKATQATIEIATSDKSKLLDDNVSRQLVQAATASLNTGLTKTYLENLYVGFNTLGDQLGEAADGAQELATGTTKFAAGVTSLSEGTHKLASGIGQLSTGTSALATGAGQLASGTSQLATGADQLADGVEQLNTGGKKTVTGAKQLQGGVSQLASGTKQFSDQLGKLSGGVAVAGGSAGKSAQDTAAVLAAMQTYQAQIQAALAGCQSDPTTCVQNVASAQSALPSEQILTALATDVTTTDIALNGSSVLAPQVKPTTGLVAGSAAAASGATQLSSGAAQLNTGFGQFVTGLGQLSDGIGATATGARKLSDGTAELSTGAGQLATGTTKLASGVAQTATGANQLAAGTDQLADGATPLAAGTTKLADGLSTAVDQIPSYTDAERTNLATSAGAPVRDPAQLVAPFNTSGVALFFVLALWIGGLAIYLVLQAVTSRALSSTRSSLRLALQGYLPGLLIGVVQGVLVGGVSAYLLDLDAGHTAGFVALAALAGASFAAVNQGLTGLFGGVGRFISVLIGVIALTAGIISTVPGFFQTLSPLLPLGVATDGFGALIDGQGSVGGAVVALLLWLVLGLLMSVFAVARRRSVRVGTAHLRDVRLA